MGALQSARSEVNLCSKRAERLSEGKKLGFFDNNML